MSLYFLCTPLPDEFFYSIAARTRQAMKCPSSRLFAFDLVESYRLKVDMGVGLAKAQKGFIKDFSPFLKTTLAAFLTSFVTPSPKRRKLQQAILNGDKITAAYLLGRMAVRRRSLQFYRYCPDCVREQRSMYGEAYWTQEPQILGFTHCPLHKREYVDSVVQTDYSKEFACLDNVANARDHSSRIFSDHLENLIDLALEGTSLFDFTPSWDTERLDRAWWRLLHDRGFDRRSHGVVKNLASSLESHYGREYLETACCKVGPIIDYSWIARFLRAPSKESDPIRHLLLLRTLGLRVNDLVETAKLAPDNPEINDSSVVCLNPVCPHFQKTSPQQTHIFHDAKTKRKIAQFTCTTCDQTIGRFLNENSIPTRYRIIDRGTVWKDELKSLWGMSKLSVRQIGVRLGAESLTVKRHALKLGLSFPRVGPRISKVVPPSPKPKNGPTEKERFEHREIWLKAFKIERTVSKARLIVGGAYAWLYRHDQDWLNEHCPEPANFSHVCLPRVDWDGRQKEFLEKLDTASLKITHRYPAQFCTVTAMLKEIRAVKYFGYIDKMPLLKDKVQELAETRVDFAIRRIELAKKKLGSGYSCTQLRQAAGLRSDLLQVKAVQNRLIIP